MTCPQAGPTPPPPAAAEATGVGGAAAVRPRRRPPPPPPPPPPRLVRWWRAGRPVVLPLAAFAAAVGGWWAAVESGAIPRFFVPPPQDAVAAAVEYRGYLAEAARATAAHTLAGYTVAVAGGVTVAALLSTFELLRLATEPLLVMVQAVPKVVLAPVFVLWAGFGWQSKVWLVVLLCFFPVVINTMAGLRSLPVEYDELARSLTAGRWKAFVKIRLQWALPQTFTGLKLAATLSLIGATVAEITNPNAGLGAIVIRAGQAANAPLAFAAIVVLAGMGVAFYYLLVAVERAAVPWARKISG